MRFETLAVHAGRAVDEATAASSRRFTSRRRSSETRRGSPCGARLHPRARLPSDGRASRGGARPLEGGEAALAFAREWPRDALLQTLPAGTRVVLPEDCYYGYRVAAREFLPAWGLAASFCDMADTASLGRRSPAAPVSSGSRRRRIR